MQLRKGLEHRWQHHLLFQQYIHTVVRYLFIVALLHICQMINIHIFFRVTYLELVELYDIPNSNEVTVTDMSKIALYLGTATKKSQITKREPFACFWMYCNQIPWSPFANTLDEIKTWITNYIHIFLYDVITQPCPTLNGSRGMDDLLHPTISAMYLLIHTPKSMRVHRISVCEKGPIYLVRHVGALAMNWLFCVEP